MDNWSELSKMLLIFVVLVGGLLTFISCDNQSESTSSYAKANRYTRCMEDLAKTQSFSYGEMKETCNIYLIGE